ncbi:MAG TPA: response regulator receiver domain [Telluria sp.]|jgi:hypothetical protein
MNHLHKFNRDAAKRYLQNIVFVDDEIYSRVSGKPVISTLDIPAFQSPFATGARDVSAPGLESAIEEKIPYHPQHLVQSFAKLGMVCALYEPENNFATAQGSELFNLCERADVMILDWDLYKHDGRNILPLIANLVDESQNSVPHHSRLCVIYSTKPELDRIASSVYDFLRAKKLEVQDVQKPATLIAGSTRIIVLGKPGVPNRTAEIKLLEVAEEDLAERVIDEFAIMHQGVLPSYALRGMAAIRRNSKKILDKFHREMDGAFLLHRALVLSDEDAFDQLPELLAEEVLAVILDDQAPNETFVNLTADAVAELPLSDFIWPVQGPNRQAGEIVRKFFNEGKAGIAGDFKFDDKNLKKKIDEIHIALGCAESYGDKKLASLFNVRTRYFKAKLPTLGFGSIVRWRENNDVNFPFIYGFCLMPTCDGMRLNHEEGSRTSFPFWTLKATNSKGRGIIVKNRENDFISLVAVVGKPRELLWIDTFKPATSGLVTSYESGGSYYFDGAEHKLEWVAQLKPGHAQRVANDIGQSFSRVGVVEAEWLRLTTER